MIPVETSYKCLLLAGLQPATYSFAVMVTHHCLSGREINKTTINLHLIKIMYESTVSRNKHIIIIIFVLRSHQINSRLHRQLPSGDIVLICLSITGKKGTVCACKKDDFSGKSSKIVIFFLNRMFHGYYQIV